MGDLGVYGVLAIHPHSHKPSHRVLFRVNLQDFGAFLMVGRRVRVGRPLGGTWMITTKNSANVTEIR